MKVDQINWPDFLDMAQFCYNSQKSSATKYSPYELATGRQPIASHLVVSEYYNVNLFATMYLKQGRKG